MDSDRARPSETVAVLLIVLGAASWMSLPVTLFTIDREGTDAHDLRVITLLLGCALGGFTAASALRAAGWALVGGAAALATGAFFAVPWLTSGVALDPRDGWVVAAASGIAAAASLAGRLIAPGRTRIIAAGAVQLALLALGVVIIAVAARAGAGSMLGVALFTIALALLAGGACAARLVPDVTGIEAALAWVVIAVSALLVQLVSPLMLRFLPIFAIAAMVTVPFAAGLAASGAAMVRPAPREELPDARAVR